MSKVSRDREIDSGFSLKMSVRVPWK